MNSAQQNLLKFIAYGKTLFDGLCQDMAARGIHLDFDWDSVDWNIAPFARYRNSGSDHEQNLLFRKWVGGRGSHSKHRDQMTPLPQPYADFTKAAAMIIWSETDITADALIGRMRGFRILYNELERNGIVDPTRLVVEHFERAVSAVNGSYKYVNCLSSIARLMDAWALTPLLLEFDHGIDRDSSTRDRRTASYQMKKLAECINNPLDDNEKILAELLRLHFILGDRIGEAVLLPLDCLVVQPNQEFPGTYRYGIRYFPEKGFEIKLKPLDRQAFQVVERSVRTLESLCAPARARAAFLEQYPDRVPIPGHPDLEALIGLNEVRRVLGMSVDAARPGYVIRKDIRNAWQLEPYVIRQGRRAGPLSESDEYLYRVGDVEQALQRKRKNHILLMDRTLKPVLRLSECLIVKFHKQFWAREGNAPVETLPEPVTVSEVTRLLGSGSAKSIFERHAMTMPDGSPIKIATHGARHIRQTFLQEAGLSNVQQAHAMGRKDWAQNRYYQHGDPEIIGAAGQEFAAYATREQERAAFCQGIREGWVRGPLHDQYQHILATEDIARAEAFLELHVGQVLFTRYGGCTNLWYRDTCSKHNKCFDDCRHLQVTGEDSEKRALEEELNLQELTRQGILEQVRHGQYRADTALSYIDRKLAGIRAALDRWEEARSFRSFKGIPVRMFHVFPEGVDRSSPFPSDDGQSEGAEGKA